MPLMHLNDRELAIIFSALGVRLNSFASGHALRAETAELIDHLSGESPQYVECSRCRRQVPLTKHRTLKDHRDRPGGHACSASGLAATKNAEGEPE